MPLPHTTRTYWPRPRHPRNRSLSLDTLRAPFVPRQVDVNDESSCELVGDAYVHDVVYGEAVKDLRPEGWKDVVI
jgi:hypothetical protein